MPHQPNDYQELERLAADVHRLCRDAKSAGERHVGQLLQTLAAVETAKSQLDRHCSYESAGPKYWDVKLPCRP